VKSIHPKLTNPLKSKSFAKSRFSKTHLTLFALIFATLGIYILIRSFAATPNALPGDINGDDTVSVQDLSILLTDYNKPTTQATNANSDINKDGTVNVLDLSILLSNYGKSGPSIINLSFSGLTNNQTVSGSITVSVDTSSLSNVAKTEYLLDNNVIRTEAAPPFCLGGDSSNICNPYDTTTISNGSHTLTFKAYDSANQVIGQTSTITFNVNNTVPPPPPPPPPPGGGGNGTITFDGTFSATDPSSGPHWHNAYGNCYTYINPNQLSFHITSSCNPAGNGHYRTDICSSSSCGGNTTGTVYAKNSTAVCTSVPFNLAQTVPSYGGNAWFQIAEMKENSSRGGDWTMNVEEAGGGHLSIGFTGGAYNNTDAWRGPAATTGWHTLSICQNGQGTTAQAWYDGQPITFNIGSCSGKTVCTGLDLYYSGYNSQPLDINAYTGNTTGPDPFTNVTIVHGDPLIATQGSNGLPPQQPGGWNSP
jgi:hypothetical protein